MSECDKCREHILDCMCHYPLCSKCNEIIYRFDKQCMSCLIKIHREFLKQIEDLIERFKNE